jgi:hypothetical protein
VIRPSLVRRAESSRTILTVLSGGQVLIDGKPMAISSTCETMRQILEIAR